jgi:drug/metabolite transporter (DMT)-like permease
MPLDALGHVLVAAFVHATWNLTLHETGDREASMAVAGFVSGGVLIPGIFIWPPWQAWPFILMSAIAQALYSMTLSAAYRSGSLGVAYPIARGTSPLLVTLGGWIILSQQPTALAALGAVCLASGLVFVASVRGNLDNGKAIGFALLTGVCISSYSLIDARAVQEVEPAGYLSVVFMLQSVIMIPMLGKGWNRRMRGSLVPGIKIGLGSIGAYLLVVLALQRADAGRVSTLREISILIGMVLSRARFRFRAWLGAALIVCGAILASL